MYRPGKGPPNLPVPVLAKLHELMTAAALHNPANGQTALYWHLHDVLQRHLFPPPPVDAGARRPIPPPGRKMSFQEARAHVLHRYDALFRLLALSDGGKPSLPKLLPEHEGLPRDPSKPSCLD